MDKKRLVLLIIRFGAEETSVNRIRESGPHIRSVVETFSDKNCKLAFMSADGGTFGWYLVTTAAFPSIKAALRGESEQSNGPSPLLNHDSCMLLEITGNFLASGFTDGGNWLQHHVTKYL